jgi:hypothetical protein
VFRNFGLFNFAGTFPELKENLGVSSAELTNRDSRSSLPDPTRSVSKLRVGKLRFGTFDGTWAEVPSKFCA